MTRPNRGAKSCSLGHHLEVSFTLQALRVFTQPFVGHTVTVFGATGFLGRYIVSRLGRYA